MNALVLLLAALAATPVIEVDDVRPGMKGFGLSVFSGTRVDTFDVEIIDVMRDAWPDGSMILCRCAGQGLEESGIIAGMSGSPVYLEDTATGEHRLCGAVAYGWNWSKQPIGGITPIREMLGVWDIPADSARSGSGNSAPPRRSAGGLSALRVPVALTGYTPALAALIGPELEQWGLLPVAAAGSAGSADPAATLVPGGPCGVVMADGDVKMAAIGTVTWREGDRLLGFGHPMFQAGSCELPLSGGIIHTVVPSVASSIKLFSTTGIVGTVVQDRQPAIAGRIGPSPKLLPVTVSLSSPARGKTYSFGAIRFSGFTPLLAAIGLAELLYSSQGTAEEMTLESRMTVFAEDTVRVEVNHCFTGEAPFDPLFRSVLAELGALFTNRFRDLRVDSIAFSVELTPGERRLHLESARVERTRVRPGGQLRLYLALRGQDGARSTRELLLDIPPTAPPGRLTLAIGSADSLRGWESARIPGFDEPRTLEGLLRRVGLAGGENRLAVAGYTQRQGMMIGDRELPAPPPSLRAVIGRPAGEETPWTTGGERLFRTEWPLDAVLTGTTEIELEVVR